MATVALNTSGRESGRYNYFRRRHERLFVDLTSQVGWLLNVRQINRSVCWTDLSRICLLVLANGRNQDHDSPKRLLLSLGPPVLRR